MTPKHRDPEQHRAIVLQSFIIGLVVPLVLVGLVVLIAKVLL